MEDDFPGFSELEISDKDYLPFSDLTNGWYQHKRFPLDWSGSHPYVFWDGCLYEIRESGFVKLMKNEHSPNSILFTEDRVWLPIHIRFWHGQKKTL